MRVTGTKICMMRHLEFFLLTIPKALQNDFDTKTTTVFFCFYPFQNMNLMYKYTILNCFYGMAFFVLLSFETSTFLSVFICESFLSHGQGNITHFVILPASHGYGNH